MRRVAVFALAAAVSLLAAGSLSIAGGPTPAGAQGNDLVTLTIGLNQDLDSPNVTSGFLVASFELWNLQYDTLTSKEADDFAITPGLAESWEGSDDGLTWTYTLREGLTWSDSTPLTADDVAYTINRSRDEEWINHSSTTANLEAVAVDDRTVEVTSSVPDPKLPTLDVYIVPRHVYEPISAEDVTTYDALDGVGSGPYTLQDWRAGQDWTMAVNPAYWGWEGEEPPIDQVVFQVFSNPDAMVAALEAGEIDAAHNVPAARFAELDDDPDIVGVAGGQGGFTELAMNGMAGGIGDGHPALLDLDVRHAIAHAVDRQQLFDRVILGLGRPGVTVSVSPDPSWQPEIPADEQFGFDPDRANQLLDDGGYADTDGDGVREMPDGSQDLRFRYIERSEWENGAAVRELITGWLGDVGIATDVEISDDTQLTDTIGSGNYDLFVWGWVPFVDPDPMLSYFTCDQVTYDVAEIGYNDANWCDSAFDELYGEQNTELDRERRVEIVHEMLRMFHDQGTYVVLFEDANLQAYRTDRFEGWLQQPAETGPVLFSNSSPTYTNLTLVDGAGDGGGSGVAALVTGAVVGAVVVGAVSVMGIRRRGSRDERE